MHTKPKRKGLPRRNWILVSIAAVVALVIGIGIGSFEPNVNEPKPATPEPLATMTPIDTVQITTQAPTVASNTCDDLEFFSVDATVYDPTSIPEPILYAETTDEARDEALPPLPVYEADSLDDDGLEYTEEEAMPMLDEAYADDTVASEPLALGDVEESAEYEVMIIPTSVASMRPEADRSGELGLAVPSSASTTADSMPESAETVYVVEQQINEPLRAGEIDDNADWDTYQTYRRNYFDTPNLAVDDVAVDGRQVIRVVDSAGRPILGACVEIYQYDLLVAQARTYATGQTLFFPNAYGETVRYNDEFRVVVSKGNATTEATLDREAIGGVTQITLDLEQSSAQQLDVLFLLDATGSMSDEIRQLQDNILSISTQIDALPENISTRYGLVAYRDRGDEYITRRYDFTGDVTNFQRDLNSVVAAGGGDTPESLNQAFYEGLTMLDWRGDDTIKLVFLVADAPPHINYSDDVSYAESMQYALANGIKVHPIASGGLDNQGEFILRQIAQHTMGKFLFLTYDDGVGGSAGDSRTDLEVGDPEDEQGVGDYSVSQLDELVLRLITDELAALRGE